MVLSGNREVSLIFLSSHYFIQVREDKIVKELMPLWIEMGFIVLVCFVEGFHRRTVRFLNVPEKIYYMHTGLFFYPRDKLFIEIFSI